MIGLLKRYFNFFSCGVEPEKNEKGVVVAEGKKPQDNYDKLMQAIHSNVIKTCTITRFNPHKLLAGENDIGLQKTMLFSFKNSKEFAQFILPRKDTWYYLFSSYSKENISTLAKQGNFSKTIKYAVFADALELRRQCKSHDSIYQLSSLDLIENSQHDPNLLENKNSLVAQQSPVSG